LILALGGAGAVLGHRARVEMEMQDRSLVKEFPDALILKAFDQYHAGDVTGAIASWEEYIRAAPTGADTTSVRELIQEARAAADSSRRRPQ
jgi:hypothetical protein